MEAERKFQFLEIMGTNVLPNEVIRHFSNLISKECWESVKCVLRAKHTFIDFNSSHAVKSRRKFVLVLKYQLVQRSKQVVPKTSAFWQGRIRFKSYGHRAQTKTRQPLTHTHTWNHFNSSHGTTGRQASPGCQANLVLNSLKNFQFFLVHCAVKCLECGEK